MEKWFRLFGRLEGVSFLVLLLLAMPLKYYAGMPVLVKVMGPVHGVFFLGYCALAIFYSIEHSWSFKVQGLALLAAIFPCGTFWFERAYLTPKI